MKDNKQYLDGSANPEELIIGIARFDDHDDTVNSEKLSLQDQQIILDEAKQSIIERFEQEDIDPEPCVYAGPDGPWEPDDPDPYLLDDPLDY